MPIRVIFKARFQCRSWLRWKQKAEKLINNNNTTKEEMSSSVVEAQMWPTGVYFQSSNTRRHQHVRFNPPAVTTGIFPFLIAPVCHRRTVQRWQEVPKGRRRKCTRRTLTPRGQDDVPQTAEEFSQSDQAEGDDLVSRCSDFSLIIQCGSLNVLWKERVKLCADSVFLCCCFRFGILRHRTTTNKRLWTFCQRSFLLV